MKQNGCILVRTFIYKINLHTTSIDPNERPHTLLCVTQMWNLSQHTAQCFLFKERFLFQRNIENFHSIIIDRNC